MFDKFYSHTSLSIVIERSVLNFHCPFISLTWRVISGMNKTTYSENPCACVLPVPDIYRLRDKD